MITRVWHGRTKPEHESLYREFLNGAGTAEYKAIPGNISVKIWRKPEGESCHFWTVTEWQDLDAIKAFAGEQYEKAVYYPEDDGILLEFEELVNHYDYDDVSNGNVRKLMERLHQVYDGGSWVEESFRAKLENLTEDDAFKQPLPGIHSVAELVWHCIYWNRVNAARLAGNNAYRDETLQEQNFLSPDRLKEIGWPMLKELLKESHLQLIDLLEGKTDSFLNLEYTTGKNFGYLIEGTIEHDNYHLGQMGLVIKIVRGASD